MLRSVLSLCLVLNCIAGTLRAAEEDEWYREMAIAPYTVTVELHWSPAPQFDPALRESVRGALSERLRRSVGASWRLTIAESNALQPVSIEALHQQTAEDVRSTRKTMKTMQVVLTQREGEIVLAAREWDAKTELFSPIAQVTTDSPKLIPLLVHQLIASVFQPLYRITNVDRDDVELIAWGAEIAPPDPDFSSLRPQGLARPVIVYRNREREIEKIQSMPLTYLHLENFDRAWVTGQLISAYPAPLGGKRKSRIELWALGGARPQRETQVRLIRQDDASRALMGQRVVILPKRFLQDELAGESRELLSDRSGIARIESIPESPLVWLYVWSGEALLARVPFVPGWSEVETLALPDDSARLRVEGDLERLQGDLTADVARRSILKIRALKAAQANNKSEAYQLLDEVRTLPGETQYRQRLQLIRTSGVEQSRRLGNRVSEARIKQACDKLQTIIVRFLDPDRDRQVIEEVDSLLKLN